MHIVVIGAGVVGVTTAYVLARDGHTVSVIERAPQTAMESSYANGGQLSFAFAAPMGTPAVLKKSLGILAGRDPAFHLSPGFLLRHLRWSLQFARACLPAAAATYSQQLAEMTAASREALNRLTHDTDIEFVRRQSGKLVIFTTNRALAAAGKSYAGRGLAIEVLDSKGCTQVDPSLSGLSGKLAGGLWIPQDEVGDAERFSRGLAEASREQFGVRYRFNESVDRITATERGVDIATSSGRDLRPDAVVICTGSAGKSLLRQLGIQLPIVPVTGYSLTAPPGPSAPDVAVTDAERKFVCSRVGDVVRIAGFADFGHPDNERRRQRIVDLIQVARGRLPAAADYDHLLSTWTGVRPATPTSLPIVGPSRIPGVYLNMGHGMYGWTLSTATAEFVAREIGTPPRRQYAA
ncbi:MAG: FAD-dependent oxidoreductase [Pseudomonadota bacterium]